MWTGCKPSDLFPGIHCASLVKRLPEEYLAECGMVCTIQMIEITLPFYISVYGLGP